MKKKIKFARVGGLSPIVQKGYTTNKLKMGSHTPPARKGFYAFIWPHIDVFLLGGSWSKLGKKNRQEKFEYVKDSNGNKVKLNIRDFDWEKDEWESELNPKLKKHLVQGKDGTFKRNDDGTDISSKFWTKDIRDKNGDWVNAFLIKKKKMKIFTYTGELWHHFKNDAVNYGDIIDEVGRWIKTDYDVFVKGLNQDRINSIKDLRKDELFSGFPITAKNVYRWISKDHMEVFIERIK